MSIEEEMIEELGKRNPTLKDSLTTLSFGFGSTGGIDDSFTWIKKGKGLKGKLFGKTVARIHSTHVMGGGIFGIIRVHDSALEEDVIESYKSTHPNTVVKKRPDGNYDFEVNREKYFDFLTNNAIPLSYK